MGKTCSCRYIAEIVLDESRHVVLNFLDGSQERLDCITNIKQTLSHLKQGCKLPTLLPSDKTSEKVGT